jgi:dGTPase
VSKGKNPTADWQDMPRIRGNGERWRASWACDPQSSRGRLHDEPESPLRSPFQRDRDRIIHSNAFRRLKHKTQVFIYHEGDHFRTRLTHTLEVAQIARSIARPLGLDEDLAEAIALAHDLGHPPFGHAGERALDRALADFGGFDHNAQSLRAVTNLEKRYPEFDGLNLTWETLEGLVKHNGPLAPGKGDAAISESSGIPYAIDEYQRLQDLELDGWPSLEAQVAAISDDIAYDSHDIEDGLRASLLSLDGLRDAPLAGRLIERIAVDYPELDETRQVHELVRRLITVMIEDVIRETGARLEKGGIGTPEEIRLFGAALCGFSRGMAEEEAGLKRFLFANLYRSAPVNRQVARAERVVGELFAGLQGNPELLPVDWRETLDMSDRSATARRVADYIAGMTDRYALTEHSRLFDDR